MQVFAKDLLTHPNENEVEICVFGPGYGESIIIHVPIFGWGVIDSCTAKIKRQRITLPYQYLLELYSEKEYPPLAFVVLTHPHQDHYNGLDKIINEYPGGVHRVCRYDGDSIRELKNYIAKQKVAINDPLPGLPKVLNSFDEAEKKGAQFRRLGELSILFEAKDIEIQGFGVTDIRMLTLGPTALNQEQYIRLLFDSYPVKGELVRPLKDEAHNLISIALFLEIGELRFVFGGDVETDPQGRLGWEGITKNIDRPNLSCSYIKVPHHGSRTGYSQTAWGEHSRDERPISTITPFVNGRHKLPEDEMIGKIKGESSVVGVTNTKIFDDNLSKYFRRVTTKAISRKTRKFQLIKPTEQIGFIRTRFKLNGIVSENIAVEPAKLI